MWAILLIFWAMRKISTYIFYTSRVFQIWCDSTGDGEHCWLFRDFCHSKNLCIRRIYHTHSMGYSKHDDCCFALIAGLIRTHCSCYIFCDYGCGIILDTRGICGYKKKKEKAIRFLMGFRSQYNPRKSEPIKYFIETRVYTVYT